MEKIISVYQPVFFFKRINHLTIQLFCIIKSYFSRLSMWDSNWARSLEHLGGSSTFRPLETKEDITGLSCTKMATYQIEARILPKWPSPFSVPRNKGQTYGSQDLVTAWAWGTDSCLDSTVNVTLPFWTVLVPVELLVFCFLKYEFYLIAFCSSSICSLTCCSSLSRSRSVPFTQV